MIKSVLAHGVSWALDSRHCDDERRAELTQTTLEGLLCALDSGRAHQLHRDLMEWGRAEGIVARPSLADELEDRAVFEAAQGTRPPSANENSCFIFAEDVE